MIDTSDAQSGVSMTAARIPPSMNAIAMPNPASSSGRPAATTAPKVRSNTTAATTTPYDLAAPARLLVELVDLAVGGDLQSIAAGLGHELADALAGGVGHLAGGAVERDTGDGRPAVARDLRIGRGGPRSDAGDGPHLLQEPIDAFGDRGRGGAAGCLPDDVDGLARAAGELLDQPVRRRLGVRAGGAVVDPVVPGEAQPARDRHGQDDHPAEDHLLAMHEHRVGEAREHRPCCLSWSMDVPRLSGPIRAT